MFRSATGRKSIVHNRNIALSQHLPKSKNISKNLRKVLYNTYVQVGLYLDYLPFVS